MYIIDI